MKEDTNNFDKVREDPLFSGRGSPALMSPKEPALNLLRERYSDSFAITRGTEKQVHLFLIRMALWSLVWTFTRKDLKSDSDRIEIDAVLRHIETALKDGNPQFLEKLDTAVMKARERIEKRIEGFKAR